MSTLYKSASGREVTHASSSSLDSFRFCRRKFRLSRVDGWKEKDKRASLEFGKCVESAIQFHSDNGRKQGDAVSEFQRLWLKWSEIKELVYTDQEQNFWTLMTMGKEMMQLYEVLLPSLPIRNPKWQLQFLKKLWPGSDLDSLEFMAYVDLLSTLEDGTRIIWDIKTAKSALDVTPGMLTMDGQLRKYAWVSGIRNVGFLNFVKADPEGFKKGYRVSLLEDSRDWKAGQTLTVAKFTAPKPAVPASEGVKEASEVFWQMLVGTEETVHKMDEILDKISGKGSKERSEAVFTEHLADGRLCSVSRDQVTKVRVQAIQCVIPEEEIAEIGQQIGLDMLNMKAANDAGFYPADGGCRFPNAVCSWCNFRGICLKDSKLRDELLVQIKPAAKDDADDWLKELETEDSE